MKFTLALIGAFFLAVETSRVASAEQTAQLAAKVKCPGHVQGIAYYRRRTWLWQDKRGVPRTVSYFKERTTHSCKFVVWSAKLWRHRAAYHWKAYKREHAARAKREIAVRQTQATVSTGAFSCIHLHEGPWNANTGNGYYGGFQQNWEFMRSYGSEFLRMYGTADKWPPGIQILVAVRARDGYNGIPARGYSPWPTSRRLCGV